MSDEEEKEDIDSDVEGVSADDIYKDTPVFNVTSQEFFNNMRQDRNRMRFGNNSKISQYIKGTNHRKPCYMRYTDSNNVPFLKKVK